MKQAFGLVWRPWGACYLKHKITGEQKSLKTSDKVEAQRILQAHNESECQPHFNLSLARVYLNGADPKLTTRTWQEVMDDRRDPVRQAWSLFGCHWRFVPGRSGEIVNGNRSRMSSEAAPTSNS